MDFASMQNCVGFNLRRASRQVSQFYDAELRRHGIRTTQTPILTALAAKSDWTMEQLSDWLGMDRTTLVRNLKPLGREGFLKIDGGGRGTRVGLSLTSKGKKELEKVQSAWSSAQKAMIKTLGEERWSAILTDLGKATSDLKQ